MRNGMKYWLAAASLPFFLVGLAQAQDLPPPPGPMVPASRYPAAVLAGTYDIDPENSAASNRRVSYRVLRFAVREGTLRWNPAELSTIAFDMTADTEPYYAPIVYKISPEGSQSLNVAKFADAKFESTAVRVKGEGWAVIEGRLILMGVTKPAVIIAELVGVGRSLGRAATIGVTGAMMVDSADFTQRPMAQMVGKVTVILDVELLKQ